MFEEAYRLNKKSKEESEVLAASAIVPDEMDGMIGDGTLEPDLAQKLHE